MKKILSVILVVIFTLCIPFTANADRVYLRDDANILDDTEFLNVESVLESASAKTGVDIVIYTLDSYEYDLIQTGKLYYKSGNYADNGIVLVINMYDNGWAVVSIGEPEDYITEKGLDHIEDEMLGYLSDGYYEAGLTAFINSAEFLINEAEDGVPYGEEFNFGMVLIVSLVIGLVIAFIIVSVMKGKLKTVRSVRAADNYMKRGSMNLIQSHDRYLYSSVMRTARPKSHSGSGGGSRGGGGSRSGHF